MKKQLNCDSYEIKNYERTEEGFLKTWLVAGIPGKILNYGDRKEIINKDSLFNEISVNSAVGKPICLNHPPVAIDSKNIGKYSKGTILQQYSEGEAGELAFSAIIHDSDLCDLIENGDIKYISAGYSTPKELNSDGILEQKNRYYNHFSVLTNEYSPRAGEESKIIIVGNEDSEVETETEATTDSPASEAKTQTKTESKTNTETENNNKDNDMKTEIKNQIDSIRKQANLDAKTKSELATKWKNLLDENSLHFNFDSEIGDIKKTILGLFYEPNIINQLNSDSLLDGFFINFQVQHDAGLLKSKDSLQRDSQDELNYDSVLESAIKNYEKFICGTK